MLNSTTETEIRFFFTLSNYLNASLSRFCLIRNAVYLSHSRIHNMFGIDISLAGTCNRKCQMNILNEQTKGKDIVMRLLNPEDQKRSKRRQPKQISIRSFLISGKLSLRKERAKNYFELKTRWHLCLFRLNNLFRNALRFLHESASKMMFWWN